MKKFLSITLVLVLLAGVGALAAEERPLTGSWENTLTLNPNQTQSFSAFDSTLSLEYVSGGITYSSTSSFDLTGYTDQTFGVSTSIGLLDLTSTMDFDPTTPDLDYWKTDASLTLGGVTISDLFLLQNMKDNPNGISGEFGAGMDLNFSGETPGGVTINVSNYFGMEPVVEKDDASGYKGEITGNDYAEYTIPYYSNYAIVTDSDAYSPSSLQYVASKLNLKTLSLGCCDFTNETLFSELNGFEYSEFSFYITSSNLPLSMEATLKFEEDMKSVTLDPSLTTKWACFEVFTDLSGTLANDGSVGDTIIDGLVIEGFAIKDVNLGDVDFSSYTALGDNTVYDLNDAFLEDTDYDEVIRIDKHAELPLDFTLDIYFDMTDSDGLFDLGYFDGSMSYALDDEFTIGSGIEVDSATGLDSIDLMLKYSF